MYENAEDAPTEGTLQQVVLDGRKAVLLPPMTADEVEAFIARGTARPVARYRVLPL